MQAVELRPLSVGEILDVGIKILWRHAWTLARVVFVVVAPVQILAALIQLSALPDSTIFTVYGTGDPEAVGWVEDDEIAVLFAAFALAGVLSLVATTLATAACYKGIADAYLGARADWRSSIGFALRRLHSLLWLTVLYFVVVGIGLVFCVVPGVYVAVAWVVAVPVLLTEGAKGGKALARSHRLVRGRWWPAFAIVILGFLIAGFVSFAVQQVLYLLPAMSIADDNTAVLLGLGTVSEIAASVISTPLVAAFTVVLYFDLRVRKEGFDLALLAERVGVAPDPSRIPLAPQAPPAAAGGSEPPYWPPPPGWQPEPPGPPPPEPPWPLPPGWQPEPPPVEPPGPPPPGWKPQPPEPPDEPPYWPPPPGWRPRGPGDE